MSEDILIEDDIKIKKEKPSKSKEFTVSDLPGVGPATVEKLADAGYDSLLSIAVASIGQLSDAAGLSESVTRKIIQTAYLC